MRALVVKALETVGIERPRARVPIPVGGSNLLPHLLLLVSGWWTQRLVLWMRPGEKYIIKKTRVLQVWAS